MENQHATILIIDDERTMVLVLSAVLKRAGYQVLTAMNGKDGLQLVQDNRPDLILCDIMMPPPNGFELRRTLSRNPSTAAIPFIFLTARTALVDKLHGIEAGADDYITKPFDNEELLARVRAVLRRATLSYNQGLTQAEAQIENLHSVILSAASQELRTPLDQILIALNLSLKDQSANDPQQYRRLMQIALDNAQRLQTLIEGLSESKELSQEDEIVARKVINLAYEFYKVIE